MKTYNLANLPDAERRAIELKKMALHQAYMRKNKMVNRTEIVRFINRELPINEHAEFRRLLNVSMGFKST